MDDSLGRVSSARRIRFSSVQCRSRSRSLHPWRGDIPHGEPTSFSELFAPALTTCGHSRLVSSGQGRQSEPTHIWSSRFLAFCSLRQDLTLTSIVSLENCPRGQLRFGGQLPISPDCVFDASLVPGTCPGRFLDLKGLINKFLESRVTGH